MSRSNPQITNNPVQRYFEWSSDDGKVKYYDKLQEKNIVLDNFSFMYLDHTFKFTGYSDTTEKMIWSNEFKNFDQIINVRAGNELISRGNYNEIKDQVKNNGGKFTFSIYIAFKIGESYEIGNLQLKGVGLNGWLEFWKKNSKEIHEKAVKIDGYQEGKKGKVTYTIPVFKILDISEQANNKAVELDKIVQEYLSVLLNKKQDDPNNLPVIEDDDLPF